MCENCLELLYNVLHNFPKHEETFSLKERKQWIYTYVPTLEEIRRELLVKRGVRALNRRDRITLLNRESERYNLPSNRATYHAAIK